jgi:hypothetical protein
MAGRLAGKVTRIGDGASEQGAVEATLFAKEGTRTVLGDMLHVEGQ